MNGPDGEIGNLRRNQAAEAATVIVRLGTYLGAGLLLLGLLFPPLLAVAVPGFVVYFGLRRKLRGDHVWLDPYGVWIGALIVNAAWAVLFLADLEPTVFHIFVIPCSLISLATAGLGLVREVQSQRAAMRSRAG
jgi:hypothetical protein